jgi:DNA-binding CsgD family transcriptional regulator
MIIHSNYNSGSSSGKLWCRTLSGILRRDHRSDRGGGPVSIYFHGVEPGGDLSGIFEEVQNEIERALERCAPLLASPAFLHAFRKGRPLTLARIERESFSYVLVRFPVAREVLTQQQIEIARLVADGLPNKSIARRLGISPATVSSHLARTYKKLHIDSRAALARQSILFT